MRTAIHRLTQFLALATLGLLFIGGLVTSTDSGLAVPDWPLSYGSLTPPMEGGIRFEHTHRVVAATVGLLMLVLTVAIGATERRAWVRHVAIACFAAVVLQGILGGLTVLYRLPAPLSITHACLGPLFFAFVVALALYTDPQYEQKNNVLKGIPLPWERFYRLVMGVKVLVFVQILLGAITRHTEAMIGFHIIGGLAVLLTSGFLLAQALIHFSKAKNILRTTLLLSFLVILEFFLGLGTFIVTRMAGPGSDWGGTLFPTFHQTLGAVILATGVILAIRSRPAFAELVIPR